MEKLQNSITEVNTKKNHGHDKHSLKNDCLLGRATTKGASSKPRVKMQDLNMSLSARPNRYSGGTRCCSSTSGKQYSITITDEAQVKNNVELRGNC